MKKYVLIIFIILLITGCRNRDSIMFKEEYESLNSNNKYIKVNIDSSNPFIYITDSLLSKKIEDKEDLVVLFGYNKSNDTRNILNNILEASKKLNIKKIYYLDILDIRDEKTINDKGEIVTTKEGSKDYNKILELLGEFAEDYFINDNLVGKRVYAPSILVIKNKEIKGIINGKSYLDDTLENKKDSYNQIYEHLKKYNSNMCDIDNAC